MRLEDPQLSVAPRLAIAIGGAVGCGLTWFLVAKGSTLQDAMTTVAAVLAALATAWAAYEASRAAISSAGAAHDAQMAIALHNLAWPHVHLFRQAGRAGAPWTWYVTIGSGEAASRLQLTWTIDGSRREASTPSLKVGDTWSHPSFLDPATRASEVREHLGSVELQWRDITVPVAWRSHVEIAPGSSTGRPVLNDDFNAFVKTELPFVNNGRPEAVE
jgi:hypothetical protein